MSPAENTPGSPLEFGPLAGYGDCVGTNGAQLPSGPLWREARRRRWGADRLLRWAGVTRPPVDVEGIAKRLGVKVEESEDLDCAGDVRVVGGRAIVRVRAQEPRVRRRFTTAHELGHLLLHEEGHHFRDDLFTGTPLEAQANGFAANLLMPMALIELYVLRYDEAELARLFDVSIYAMQVRLGKWAGLRERYDGNR